MNIYKMRKEKAILFAACLLLGASMRVFAAGESCSSPIKITKDFNYSIKSAGSFWFVANTFDLPLAIDYYPSNANAEGPVLELDFGCKPGEYDDPILCKLFCATNPGRIVLPHVEKPSPSYDKEGKLRYHLEMGEFYRDLLLEQGIDYNVTVYVRATFSSSGTIGISPDPFSTCMDGQKFMHLGDTVRVNAKDGERHVIVPYIQWQNDSIRYIWKGDKQVTLAVMGKKCDFDPLDNSDENMLQWKCIQPGDTLKMTVDDIQHYLQDKTKPKDGGMYYAKFYSNSPGVMKIERVPAAPAEGGAKVLVYNKQVDIRANGIDDLYAIPASWTQATLFTTPSDKIFKMYIGTSSTFAPAEAISVYRFEKLSAGHQLGLFESDMKSLWKQTEDKYLYVRFECSESTTLLPTIWAPSECVMKTKKIAPDEPFTVAGRSTANHRLLYTDWSGGDMTIDWQCQTGACPFYFGDSCIQQLSEENVHVFYTGTIGKNNSVTIPADDVDSWRSHVDGDGYIYVVFNPNNKGTVTLTTTAEGEKDPVYPRVSIHVACTDGDPHSLIVKVAKAQQIAVTGDNFSEEWDAVPEEIHPLSLPSGTFRLLGESETITILVP